MWTVFTAYKSGSVYHDRFNVMRARLTLRTGTTVPVAPSSLTASAKSSSQIDLAWADNSNSEDSFKIERKTGSGGTWSQIATVGANTTTYSNTGLSASTTYYYRVRASNAAGDSAYSNEANATTPDGSPAPPSNLTAAAVSASQINLSWTDTSSNETGFRVERAEGAGALSVVLKTYNGSNTAPTVEAAGTANSFRVGALVVNDRTDTWTLVPVALTGKARLLTARADRQQAPVDSKYVVTVSGPCDIYLPVDPRYGGSKLLWMDSSWTDAGMTCNSSAKTGWKIWKKSVGAGDVTLGCDTGGYDGMCYVFVPSSAFAEIATVGANVTGYSDTGLAANSTYTYRVRAYNASGNSGYSNEASATTLGSSNNPPTVSITIPTNGATYTAPANITVNVTASDSDGSVTKVEFFQGATKLGEDTTSPYSYTWSSVVAGSYTLTAKATDNSGATTISSPVNVTVDPAANVPPTVSITIPSNGATYIAPANITINATASDSDGSVTKVEFYNGAVKLGEDTTSPYSYTWSGVSAGSYSLTAKATDNSGATTTSGSVDVIVEEGSTYWLRIIDYTGSKTEPSVEQAGTANSFRTGALVVNDRSDTWTSVPTQLSGLDRILAARDDRKVAPTDAKYQIAVDIDCIVYVILDPRYTTMPGWINMDGWIKTSMTANSNALSGWSVWTKTLTSGTYWLGCDTIVADGVTYIFEIGSTPIPPPSAPSGLTAIAVSSSQINLSWTDNSAVETGFRIERKTGAGGTWSQIATTNANVTTYNNTGLTVSTTYYYRVRATNSAGDSAYSNEASATTQSAPAVLVISNIATASGQVYVQDTLATGKLCYIDRTYIFTSVGAYNGEKYIRTANSDKKASNVDFLSFDVNMDVTVYVVFDTRATSLPVWLSSWTNTGNTITTSDVGRKVYSKQFSAGNVVLGGNSASGMVGASSMYNPIIVPNQ